METNFIIQLLDHFQYFLSYTSLSSTVHREVEKVTKNRKTFFKA